MIRRNRVNFTIVDYREMRKYLAPMIIGNELAEAVL
jgi:hypothetical protein